jgi:hypothetical protein
MDVYVERTWFMTDDARWGPYPRTVVHRIYGISSAAGELGMGHRLTCSSPPYRYSSHTLVRALESACIHLLHNWSWVSIGPVISTESCIKTVSFSST